LSIKEKRGMRIQLRLSTAKSRSPDGSLRRFDNNVLANVKN